MFKNKSFAILLGILVVAALLRAWGIWNVSTTDEYNEVLEALRVCSGNLNFERWFKRFYLYVLSLEYGVYYTVGWLFGAFASPMDFAEKIVRNMEPLFIMGRLTSAAAGSATVAVLYLIGDRFHSRLTAIAAALFLTFTVFHIDLSQQAKVDATLGLMITISLYFLYKILETGKPSKWDFVFCGVAMALAVQAKINAVVLVFPLAYVIVLCFRQKGLVRNMLCYFVPAGIAGFIIGNPPVLLAPGKFLSDLMGMGKVYTTAVNVVPNELIGFLAYPLYYYKTMGAILSVFTVIAIVWSIWRPTRKRLLLFSFIIPFYMLMGASKNMVAVYYMIPILPFLYLVLGDVLHEILETLGQRANLSKEKVNALAGILLVLSLVHPVYKVYVHERSLYGPNTRYVAKQWIEAHIPEDSRILMDSGKSINSFAPPIARNRASISRRLNTARENVAEGRIVHKMVNEDALIYYELLLKTVPELSYDITSTQFGLQVKPLEYYVANNFDYIILSEGMREARTNPFFEKRNPQIAEFYESSRASSKLELVKTIAPTKYNQGSTFYIYRVKRG
jgi:hypothetical protein